MSKIRLEEGSEEFKAIKKEWQKRAKASNINNLAEFLEELTENYAHDYGTICHAAAVAAQAAAWAVDHSPQGGITGFQAGAIMWQFIREWNFSSNKTGLAIVDYDNFLCPQYSDRYDKTLSPSVWANLQKEAAVKVAEADQTYAKYLEDLKRYEGDILTFVAKFPDYEHRREHYDRLGSGTGEERVAQEEKEAAGFEFAPTKPHEPIKSGAPAYDHWQSIVGGAVPFGYQIKAD